MKFLFVLLVVVGAAMAEPEALRERRGILAAAPVLAPRAAIITPALSPVLAGHGGALVGAGPVITAGPLGGLVGPALWG